MINPCQAVQLLPQVKRTAFLESNMENNISLEELLAIIETKKPVFVKIGADWCSHCNRLDAFLNKTAPSNKEVMFVKITSDNPNNTQVLNYLQQVSGGAEISFIPVIMSFKDGKFYKREKPGFTERRVNELMTCLPA